MNCTYCRSEHVVKAGVRKLKSGRSRQLYRCNECCRRFSSAQRHGKRTPGKAILRALVLVCRGCSYDEATFAIRREFGVERSKACVSRWVTERTLPYLEIREKMAIADGPLVRSYLFTHSNLNYRYQIHFGKLLFAKAFPELVRYLKSLPNWLDHHLFAKASHCSQMELEDNSGLKHYTGTRLSKMTAEAIPLAQSNFQRHNVVEDYLLNGDRNTIAVEIPVYFRHPAYGLIAGHIDLLQVSGKEVQILDYKPRAAHERPAKVVSQLTLYAQALSRRAKLPIGAIRCGWFDEHDAYYFRPKDLTSQHTTDTKQKTSFKTFQADRSKYHATQRSR